MLIEFLYMKFINLSCEKKVSDECEYINEVITRFIVVTKLEFVYNGHGK